MGFGRRFPGLWVRLGERVAVCKAVADYVAELRGSAENVTSDRLRVSIFVVQE